MHVLVAQSPSDVLCDASALVHQELRAREEPLADPSAHLRAESSQRACATADRGGLLCGPMASIDPRVGAVYHY
jgi:hypothetical protein